MPEYIKGDVSKFPVAAMQYGRSVERPRKRLGINYFSGRSTEHPYCGSGNFDTPLFS